MAPTLPLLNNKNEYIKEVLNARSRSNIAALAIAECHELTEEEEEDDMEDAPEVEPVGRVTAEQIKVPDLFVEEAKQTMMIDTTQTRNGNLGFR